jgi:hypothetical protein
MAPAADVQLQFVEPRATRLSDACAGMPIDVEVVPRLAKAQEDRFAGVDARFVPHPLHRPAAPTREDFAREGPVIATGYPGLQGIQVSAQWPRPRRKLPPGRAPSHADVRLTLTPAVQGRQPAAAPPTHANPRPHAPPPQHTHDPNSRRKSTATGTRRCTSR